MRPPPLLFWGCSLCAVLVVSLSTPGNRCSPLPSLGKKDKEGEERNAVHPSLQLDSHTPRRHSKLRRQSPQQEGWPRAPPAVPALREPVRGTPMGDEGRDPSAYPTARSRLGKAPNPQRDARIRHFQPGRARGAQGQGREMRTRSGQSGIKVRPAETYPRRISRAP